MASLPCFKYYFTPKWPMTLVFLLVFGLLLSLGIWQLERAKEKEHMLFESSKMAKSLPETWDPKMTQPLQYQKIRVAGYYLKDTFLLDNQYHQHKLGYHVLTPFLLQNDEIILIDRGFVSREYFSPSHPVPELNQSLIQPTGQVYYPSTKQWVLGSVLEKQEENLTVLEIIDNKLLTQLLHKFVYPFIIRLDKDNPHGFVREWPVVSMSPERHRAYAFQWFAMALCIFIMYVGLNLKKKHEN